MQKRTIFILQNTKESIEKIEKCFAKSEDYEIINTSTDGKAAIPLILDKKPDVLITELVLADYDGLSVIEKIRELKLNVKIIVLSTVLVEDAISKSISAGADYFLAKPFSEESLKKRIDDFFDAKEHSQVNGFNSILEGKISKLLINIGIPPHLKGYTYLKEGVLWAVEDHDIINNVTTRLYPIISKKFSSNSSSVERAIRRAIEIAWDKGLKENINTLFGACEIGAEKPTNSEFIALATERILLDRT